MSCPFYGVGVLGGDGRFPATFVEQGGNRCGLITDAHSPCYMEVAEERTPEWQDCPRNPNFIVVSILKKVDVTEQRHRMALCSGYLISLYKARQAAEPSSTQ